MERRPNRIGSLVLAIGLSLQAAQPALTVPARASAKSTNAPGLGLGPGQRGEAPLEVAKAVMVTVELEFGRTVPTIAEALSQIERRSKPADGVGRTFAILDAYGQPTGDGKLHMSMHVSSEKPGHAALVFKRTGEVLWETEIVKGTNAPATNLSSRGLVILIENAAGQAVTVDGSNNPRSVLDATVKEMGVTVSDMWPEGSEREVTLLYSACGCPVKVKAMRVGNKTVRTRPLPVIFPDDPAVVNVIKRLMGWE